MSDRIDKVVLITGASSGIGEATVRILGASGAMAAFRAAALNADAIARSIHYAISQPSDVDVSEIIVRPPASDVI